MWSGAAGTLLLIPVDAERVYGWASATRGGAAGADPQWLWSTFADYPEPVSSALSSLRAEPASLYYSRVEEIRLDRWHHGRVVLIGDAAHATAPVWAQGAALAAENALVLGDLPLVRSAADYVGGDPVARRRCAIGASTCSS